MRFARQGKPRHLVSDRGAQFVSRKFTRLLSRRRIRRRFGAVGRHNSIAKIERFWRSAKEERLRGLLLWMPLGWIEARIFRWVAWYNGDRPHSGLGLRTPDEVHRGARPRPIRRVERGVLEVRLLDGDPSLPIFRLRPAA